MRVLGNPRKLILVRSAVAEISAAASPTSLGVYSRAHTAQKAKPNAAMTAVLSMSNSELRYRVSCIKCRQKRLRIGLTLRMRYINHNYTIYWYYGQLPV